MKTSKGCSFENLLDISTGIRRLTVTHTEHLPFQRSDLDSKHSEMVAFITDVIQKEKKGAGVYQKCLEQIEHHRSLMIQAYAKLYDSYEYATNPDRQRRTSPIEKARREMLEAMPDKLLRMNATVYLDEEAMNDIILPDDREKLIELTLEAMRKDDSK